LTSLPEMREYLRFLAAFFAMRGRDCPPAS
jgi:hypothetical protein